MALLREGALEQAGTPRELYRVPRTEYAANFFGPGSVWRGSSSADRGSVFADTPLGRIPLDHVVPGPVVLVFRPEAIRLDDGGGVPGSVRRVSYGAVYVVSDRERAGNCLVTLAIADLDLHASRLRAEGLALIEESDDRAPRRLSIRDDDGNKITFFQDPALPTG